MICNWKGKCNEAILKKNIKYRLTRNDTGEGIHTVLIYMFYFYGYILDEPFTIPMACLCSVLSSAMN